MTSQGGDLKVQKDKEIVENCQKRPISDGEGAEIFFIHDILKKNIDFLKESGKIEPSNAIKVQISRDISEISMVRKDNFFENPSYVIYSNVGVKDIFMAPIQPKILIQSSNICL